MEATSEKEATKMEGEYVKNEVQLQHLSDEAKMEEQTTKLEGGYVRNEVQNHDLLRRPVEVKMDEETMKIAHGSVKGEVRNHEVQHRPIEAKMDEETAKMEGGSVRSEVQNHEGSRNGEEEARKVEEKVEDSPVEKTKRSEEDRQKDAELFSCLLQTSLSGSDPFYVGVRRLLLYRKALSGIDRRKEWRCNGKAYVAYRNYIRRPRNWENLMPSQSSTPGNSGRWASSPSLHSVLYEGDSWGSSRDLQGLSSALSHGSASSTFSESDHSLRFVEPAYSFVGMHCIFDSCKASVTVVKFGHMSSDVLAYGASDGSLTVCTVTQPPAVLQQLIGHSKDITDFDFSLNNQYICSSSLDKTLRIWEISKGHCMRVIYGVSPQLCVRFHPVNNNFLLVGNSSKEITVINFSTGRIIRKASFEYEITAMDIDHTGQLIFAGDSQGCVHTVSMNSHTGTLSRSHRNRSISKSRSPVTTVQYRIFSLLARAPVLLTCSQDGNISFFSITMEIKGYLTLRCSLKVAPRTHGIQASFCPLLSLEKGEFIVSGSEDSSVYFYDLTRPKHTCVNKLQGHGSPVVGIAWNHGENLLASSDSEGTVIVWKRAKANKKT